MWACPQLVRMNENLKSNEWPRLLVAGRAHGESSSSKVFASLRSSISSPSVNQPQTRARSSRALP